MLKIILLYPIEGGSFWLDVRGYEMSARKYSRSAIESVWAGKTLKSLYASRCKSPMLKGVGERRTTCLLLRLFTTPSLPVQAFTIDCACASVSTFDFS